jgi:hypothetical protein
MEGSWSARRLFGAAASETAQDGAEVNRRDPWVTRITPLDEFELNRNNVSG